MNEPKWHTKSDRKRYRKKLVIKHTYKRKYPDDIETLFIGDKVQHEIFGSGNIVDEYWVEAYGKVVKVFFDGCGMKNIIANLSKLEMVKD